MSTRVVKVNEAKTHLSSLLAEVERGGEIVIARGDQAVARLIPLERASTRRLGGLNVRLPDDFYHPLPDDELDLWEGALDDRL